MRIRLSTLAEWGLSILAETDDVTILVDTGPSASAFLAHELGDRFFFNQAGTITEFEV